MIVLAIIALSQEAFAAPKKVAIYVEGPISKESKSIVNSAVLARMSGNKNYTPFERNASFIKALNSEQDYQVSGEVPEKEIREVGQRMGVDYVVVVKVVLTDDFQCHMSARLIDLVTGEILKSVNLKRQYTGSDVLSTMSNNISYRLLNRTSK